LFSSRLLLLVHHAMIPSTVLVFVDTEMYRDVQLVERRTFSIHVHLVINLKKAG